MPETPYYVVPTSRSSAGFRYGRNVDIVGVGSSILPTPTIDFLEMQGFQRFAIGFCEVPGRFKRTCPPFRAYDQEVR